MGAGQLIAWMDSELLRDAARQTLEEARDAQRQMGGLGSGPRRPARDAYARAINRAESARKALMEAQALADKASTLADNLEAARLAADQAASEEAAAQTQIEKARAAAPTSPTQEPETSLESDGAANTDAGSAAGTGRGAAAGEDPAVTAALAALRDASRRKEEADRNLRSARRRAREAEQASTRIATLTERAQSAEAAAEAARVEMEQEQAAGASTDAEGADQRRQASETQAAAMQARLDMKDLVLVSPGSGVVEFVPARAGDEVPAGQQIATLRLLDRVWADVAVPTERAGRLQPKQTVSVRRGDGALAPLKGTILEIAPAGSDAKAPRLVKVAIDNPDAKLTLGTTVQITFP